MVAEYWCCNEAMTEDRTGYLTCRICKKRITIQCNFEMSCGKGTCGDKYGGKDQCWRGLTRREVIAQGREGYEKCRDNIAV